MAREWTNQELTEYIKRFTDVQRDDVLKQLLESDLIAQFFSKTEGRLILNNVVDSIATETMNIVRLCLDGHKKNLDDINQAALKINTAYKFMYSIAKMAMDGQSHIDQMKSV